MQKNAIGLLLCVFLWFLPFITPVHYCGNESLVISRYSALGQESDHTPCGTLKRASTIHHLGILEL